MYRLTKPSVVLALVTATLMLCAQVTLRASAQSQPATVTISGQVTAFQAPSSTSAGSITIAGRTLTIDAGTAITNQNLIVVGSQIALMATLDSSNNITNPATVMADTATVETVCGMVTAFTAPTATQGGSLTIMGQTFQIEAGAQFTTTSPITVGSNNCLTLTLDAFGQIVAATQTSTASICGMVTVYTAATSTAAGTITIDGQTFVIATGTAITNDTTIVVGQNVCINVTFNSSFQIVAPSSASANHPPTLTIPGPQSVTPGSALSFTVSATGVNSGETLQLSASGLPANATFNAATGQFSFSPTDAQAGQTFVVNFTATSSLGPATTGSVVIRVSGSTTTTTGPAIFTLPSSQVIQVGQTLVFRVSAVDSAGNPFTVTALDLPGGAQFDSASGTLTFTPTATEAGQTLPLTFIATSSTGMTSSATVMVQVLGGSGGQTANLPVISAPLGPVIITSGTATSFNVSAESPKPNCAVVLTSSTLPANATFNPATGVFSFQPAASQENQSFFVTFTATDCGGQTSTSTVSLVVVPSTGPLTGSASVPVTKIFFTSIPVGSVSAPITITLNNLGGGTLSISSVKLASGADFHLVSTPGPVALEAGGQLSITVQFQPTTKGEHVDQLLIASNDPNQPNTTIILKGKGTKPVAQ